MKYEVLWEDAKTMYLKEFSCEGNAFNLPAQVKDFVSALGDYFVAVYVLEGDSCCSFFNADRWGEPDEWIKLYARQKGWDEEALLKSASST